MENNNMEKIDQETLSAILKEHQLWLDSKGGDGKKADLSNKNLKFVNLEAADLRRANLEAANLVGANLERADLAGADLAGTDLRIANLREAILLGANLEGANLEGADLEGANLKGVKHTLLRPNSDRLLTDNLQRKLQSSEATIQELEEKLKQAQQAQSNTVKNDEEITQLSARLEQEKLEKEKIKEELNSKIKELTEGLSNRIKDAQKSLSEALKNTDNQIQNNENTACWFKWLGIILFGLAIILLLVFSGFVLCNSKFFIEKNLNILFYTFPIITLMVIGTTCLRHQKNLLGEIRHFSNMKHQIELYSGLLEASQHAAVSFNHPEKANEYVQETFTQIRNRLLNSQYLPDNSSADKQSDNDFGSDKVLDLLNKIADLSGKKSMGN